MGGRRHPARGRSDYSTADETASPRNLSGRRPRRGQPGRGPLPLSPETDRVTHDVPAGRELGSRPCEGVPVPIRRPRAAFRDQGGWT